MGRLRTVAVVALLVFAAVACSDKTTTTPSSGGTTPAGGSTSGGTIVNKGTADATAVTEKQEIEMDNEGSTEFYFKPTFIKVKAGQIVTIELKNEGSVPHNFSITSLAINKTVEAGKEDEVTITFPTGGTDIQFFCSFHSGSGMKGAFFFGSAPASAGGTSGGGSSNTSY